ncbi:MAG: metal ABC transporter ATP-binding protein [Candidatus Njordarchaeia archaeon]
MGNENGKWAILVENMTVRYNDHVALENITFKLKRSHFLTVMGPNGAGKTTLLRAILGLIKPVEGRVEVEGINVLENPQEVRRLTAYVPQRTNIVKNMPIRVWDIVVLGRKTRKGIIRPLNKRDYIAIKRALETVGLWELRRQRFSNLSGGQQQRALIARALAMEPKILLLDEALSGVDVVSGEIIINTLREVKGKGVTIVYVTHDINEVMDLADKILILKGEMVAFGKPSDVLREEILAKAYGSKVKVFWDKDKCFALIGDKHA